MELLPFLGAAKGDRSDLAGAEHAYREAIELAALHGREDVRWHSDVAIEHLRLATAAVGIKLDHVLRKGHDAIAALEGSGNELALTLAWFLIVERTIVWEGLRRPEKRLGAHSFILGRRASRARKRIPADWS